MSKRHFVSISTDSPRIFKSNFFEFFSKSPWYLPLFYWLPILSLMIYFGIVRGQMDGIRTLLLFLLGIAFWSLLEYVIHRFIYHWEPKKKEGTAYRIHFLLHGFHHDYPNDRLRLVAPLSLSTILAIPIFGFLVLVTPNIWTTFVVFSGTILGYLFYDITHYALHHFDMEWGWAKRLRKHHLSHHYNDDNSRYGVSFLGLFWDYVFGTKGRD